jgi:sec-independent protein translocase protein TatA
MLSGITSPTHLLLLLVVVVLLFGAKRLPEAARGIGQSARVLKAELSGLHEDEKDKAPKTATPEAKTATPELNPSPGQVTSQDQVTSRDQVT